MQNYPSMLKHQGIIRLRVAAICTALDTMISRCEEREEEVAPFLAIVEKKYYDMKTKIEHVSSSPIEPHAFLYMTPTGDLKELFDLVLTALKQSVATRELDPVALKVDVLTGEISAEDTWITTEAFSQWCPTRDLEIDDFCAHYEDAEETIWSRVDDVVYDERREFESPHFDARYKDRKISSAIDQFQERTHDALLRENIFLRMGFDPDSSNKSGSIPESDNPQEKPLRTTERNALLSIIAVLCDENGYNTDRAAKTAAIIKNRADLAGISLGETTVENHLKKIPDAVTRRLRR